MYNISKHSAKIIETEHILYLEGSWKRKYNDLNIPEEDDIVWKQRITI